MLSVLRKQRTLWLFIFILAHESPLTFGASKLSKEGATSIRIAQQKQVVLADNHTVTLSLLSPSRSRNLAKCEPTEEDNILVKQQQEQRQYAVLVDCGSSGSRARVYHWPAGTPTRSIANEIKPVLEPTTGQVASLRIRPGISSFGSNPELASDYLRPIMRFASQMVPMDLQEQTPVYILATAGMRLLGKREQRAIWADIQRDVRLEFPNFQDIRTEIISGAQEGAYQWLSTNALAQRLRPAFDQESGLAFHFQAPSARRLATLEMGGASAQVTFEVSSSRLDELQQLALKHQPEALKVFQESRLQYEFEPGERVALISVTFLGFGADSARLLAVDLLVRDALGAQLSSHAPFFVAPNSTLILEDPCLNLGAHETLEKPMELIYGQAKSIGYLRAQVGADTLRISLMGRGNYVACRRLLARMATIAGQEKLECDREEGGSCAASLIGTNFVPWRQLQFVGLGELFYTQSEIFHSAGQLDGPKLQLMTARLCSLPFEQLNLELRPKSDFERRRNLLACFKANWIITWLSSVLKMPIHFHPLAAYYDLTTVNKFGLSDELDWTLGALIARQLE